MAKESTLHLSLSCRVYEPHVISDWWWTATLSAKWNCCCKQPSSFICWQLLTVSNILFTNRPIFNFWQWCWGRYSIAAEGVSVQSGETVCIFLVQASFVMQHQNAVVYVALFLAVMMLPSSFVLIFTQHINIRHVILLTHCCVSLLTQHIDIIHVIQWFPNCGLRAIFGPRFLHDGPPRSLVAHILSSPY